MSKSCSTPSRWRRALGALGAAALLAGCGGGTSQFDPFVPLRLFSFGDEMSALTDTAPLGRNYAVNGLSDNNTPSDPSDDVIACALQPNWVQSMAGYYGFVFSQCNPDNVAEPRAVNHARARARVADVEAQVQARVDAGGFRDKDIATLMVGINDVIDLYGQYPGTDEATLIAEARARGRRAALIVNRIVALGSKVIVANIPDMGLSPFAIAERAKPQNQDADRAALISRLSAAFNEQLGVNILLDGRFVGLAQIDQRSQAIARSPAGFLFGNVTEAECTVAPPDCTTATLKPDALTIAYLWADDRWFSSAGHTQLAVLALARAQRNPF